MSFLLTMHTWHKVLCGLCLIADIDFQKLNFAKITAHSVERWNRKFSNAANASTTRAENTLDQAKIVPWNILQMPLK